MAFRPIYMKDVNLILGDEALGDDYKCQARSVVLTPEANTTRIKTLCPDGTYANVDQAEWTLEIGYLYGVDTVDPTSLLTTYLLDNEGEKVPFFFAPESGGAGWTGTITVTPGAMGGEQGNFSEQTVQLPLDGRPEAWAGTGGS